MIARSINPSSFTKPASFRSLFRRPDVTYRFALHCFLYVDAQLQVGQVSGIRFFMLKRECHDNQ